MLRICRILSLTLVVGCVSCLDTAAYADDPADTSRLESALNELDAWIGPAAKGDRWRTFLHSEELRRQIAAGANADLEQVTGIAQKYHSGIAGLELRRFAAVRQALDAWLESLIAHSDQSLSDLVWTLRGEHQPLTNERFAAERKSLCASTQALLAEIESLPGDTNWKEYLRWELLEPHFEDDCEINRETLQQLDAVLRRFHTDEPGLELPVFTETALAIERYRELAFWNALARRRDTSAIYETYVKQLQEQLRRHEESPTVETERQIGKSLAVIDYLGHAPALVKVIRARYDQPNVMAHVSLDALNRLPQPVYQIQPVRDCILGANVRGTAQTSGDVMFVSHESDNHIALDVHLAGHITTNTLGYRKPVVVSTTGHTNYSAMKRLTISDQRFDASDAFVSASTRNRTNSIRKTGGKFGKKFVEKIAWKKVREKKAQGERIAAQKARRRVASGFDERVIEALTQGRVNYEGKIQFPIIRRGFVSDYTHFTSTTNALMAHLSLATGRQIATSSRPPERNPKNDITVQMHETAINNFLPSVLSGVIMVQDVEDQPQRLEGDVPEWLKKAAAEKRAEGEPGDPTPADPTPADVIEEGLEEKFRPYRLELNSEHPASVSFNDNVMTLRLRFAKVIPNTQEDKPPLDNWDFLVSYKVTDRDGTIALTRVGEIEVFPTGFDPRWDTKLSSEQVGYRNNLARNLNRRANQGEGFPQEIIVPQIKLSNEGKPTREFKLRQLDCDDGWLTVGYQVL